MSYLSRTEKNIVCSADKPLAGTRGWDSKSAGDTQHFVGIGMPFHGVLIAVCLFRTVSQTRFVMLFVLIHFRFSLTFLQKSVITNISFLDDCLDFSSQPKTDGNNLITKTNFKKNMAPTTSISQNFVPKIWTLHQLIQLLLKKALLRARPITCRKPITNQTKPALTDQPDPIF